MNNSAPSVELQQQCTQWQQYYKSSCLIHIPQDNWLHKFSVGVQLVTSSGHTKQDLSSVSSCFVLHFLDHRLRSAFSLSTLQHTKSKSICKAVHLRSVDSCIDWSPAISFNAVNAMGPKGPRGNIIQVCTDHPSTAVTGAINLGG